VRASDTLSRLGSISIVCSLRRVALPSNAVFTFLKPVSKTEDKEIATDLRRITLVQLAPFEPQFFKSERLASGNMVDAFAVGLLRRQRQGELLTHDTGEETRTKCCRHRAFSPRRTLTIS